MGLDQFKTGSSREGSYPDLFREHVSNWDWPACLSQGQTEQAENVTAVIWRMKNADEPITEETFKKARDERASVVRKNDPELDEDYSKTVHKNCVTNLGYRGDNGFRYPMWAFVKEARYVIEEYKKEE